ncbi:hypothetical protein TNCV_1334281 [Trichonephila clavipes]|nr:hypothetical protein TNCV_1334281 [Trichonephila clavipes]
MGKLQIAVNLPLVRLGNWEERWEALNHLKVFSFKIGLEPSKILLSPTWCSKASIVYHLVLPEIKMRRSRLLEEIRMDLVQPEWDMRSELPNRNKILKGSFAEPEDIR